VFEKEEQNVLLPSQPPYLTEDTSGIRRFVFLTTNTPLPLELSSRISASPGSPAPLDITTLQWLARHLVNDAGCSR
jgi:hypothetical protein